MILEILLIISVSINTLLLILMLPCMRTLVREELRKFFEGE